MKEVHAFKVRPQFYQALVTGGEDLEARFNDRGFHEGDLLVFEEFDLHTNSFTGQPALAADVTGVRCGDLSGVPQGFVVMSIHLKEWCAAEAKRALGYAC